MSLPKKESIIDWITSAPTPRRPMKCDKDFVKSNIIENIRSVPRKLPPPVYVDTRRGDRHLLKTSGLLPIYSRKKDFGETPEYLKQRKESWRAQQEHDSYEHTNPEAMKQRDARRGGRHLPEPSGPKYINKRDYGETPEYLVQRNDDWRDQKDYDNYVQGVLNREAMRSMSEVEGRTIIESLKKSFDERLQQYQSLPFHIDTPGKKRRKDCLESGMKQLENLINLLESKPVYISNPLVMKPAHTSNITKECRETTKYLQQCQEEIDQHQKRYDDYVKEQIEKEDMELLPDAQKQLIIHSLKNNFETLHDQCKGLSGPDVNYNSETLHGQCKGFSGVKCNVPKTVPKEHLESVMKQTENVINVLTRKNVYIANSSLVGLPS